MNKTYRELKKVVNQQIKDRQYKKDKNQRIIINMTVKNDDDFLSVFSQNDTPVISHEVAEFIEHSTDSLPPNELLTLRIHSSCIDDQEKILYQNAIKEYYLQKYISNENELKRNNIIAFVLALAGVFTLAFKILYEYMNNNIVWAEVIDIVAWVLLWEGADIVFFGNRALNLKKKRYLSYISMNIEYIDYPETVTK